ncbi:hypothetical protein H0W26_04915 [Candidatus Dependentiae bacterium]|nr:hypothetical protein [Candidatus Dependentiae bacterium]
MKKNGFFIIFTGMQLLFLFFYVYHQHKLVSLSYVKQRYEKKKQELLMKKQDLKQALQESHDLTTIKDFALNAHMKKITLDQLRTIPHEQQS